MLLIAAKCQGYSFHRFWIIKEKPTLGVKFLPPPAIQIRVKKTTFLENTRDVLQCLDQINYISENALLVSLGGVNLYPDIPKECRKYAVFPWKTWRPIGITWKSLKTSKCSTKA